MLINKAVTFNRSFKLTKEYEWFYDWNKNYECHFNENITSHTFLCGNVI